MIDGTLIEQSDDKKSKKLSQFASVITEVARDYDPSWMKCGEMYNSEFVVGIDSFCNFFVLKRNIDSLNEDERGRLDVVCRMYWGDDINTISRGSLVMDIPYDTELGSTNQNETTMTKTAVSDKVEMDESDDENEHKDDEKKGNVVAASSSSYNVSPLKPDDL